MQEFLQAINITSSGRPEQKLEWAFNMYDVNGDGTIEPHEMSEIIGVGFELLNFGWTRVESQVLNIVFRSLCDKV